MNVSQPTKLMHAMESSVFYCFLLLHKQLPSVGRKTAVERKKREKKVEQLIGFGMLKFLDVSIACCVDL